MPGIGAALGSAGGGAMGAAAPAMGAGMGAAGGAMSSAAPAAMAMPMAKPGLMSNLMNPSFLSASGIADKLPGMMGQMGQQMQGQGEDRPPPPPPPAMMQSNPQALQMAMQIMQQLEQRGAGRPQMQGGMPGRRF